MQTPGSSRVPDIRVTAGSLPGAVGRAFQVQGRLGRFALEALCRPVDARSRGNAWMALERHRTSAASERSRELLVADDGPAHRVGR